MLVLLKDEIRQRAHHEEMVIPYKEAREETVEKDMIRSDLHFRKMAQETT